MRRVLLLLGVLLLTLSSGCVSMANWSVTHEPVWRFYDADKAWLVAGRDGAPDEVHVEFKSIDRDIGQFESRKHSGRLFQGGGRARYLVTPDGTLQPLGVVEGTLNMGFRLPGDAPPPAPSDNELTVDAVGATVTLAGMPRDLPLVLEPSTARRAAGWALLPVTVPVDVALSPLYLVGGLVFLAVVAIAG